MSLTAITATSLIIRGSCQQANEKPSLRSGWVKPDASDGVSQVVKPNVEQTRTPRTGPEDSKQVVMDSRTLRTGVSESEKAMMDFSTSRTPSLPVTREEKKISHCHTDFEQGVRSVREVKGPYYGTVVISSSRRDSHETRTRLTRVKSCACLLLPSSRDRHAHGPLL
jgi:hypothetical protein